MPPQPIKVLCVDDNFLVSEGIRLKLRMEGGFEWLGQLNSADRLIAEVKERRPDVVLLDLDMPGKDAFTALRELHDEKLETRVIIISGFVRSDLVDRAVEAGAWGYVSKGDSTDAVVNAIRQVMKGQFALAPNTASAEDFPRH